MLGISLESIGMIEIPAARVLWIKNTLDLGEVEASVAYLDQVEDRDDLEIISDPREMTTGDDNNLPAFEVFATAKASEPVPADD